VFAAIFVVIRIPLYAGVDPHKPDDRGVTAAQVAREAGHESIIRTISSGGPFAGWMDKLGEGILASYKLRWVALEQGTMRYFPTPEAHRGGALPIKGNVIPLEGASFFGHNIADT
jgi:hypothetical protein